MRIIIGDGWLEATGNMHLSGVELPAKCDKSKSHTAMGFFYDVVLPDGRSWCVFSTRGVTVVLDAEEFEAAERVNAFLGSK